MGQAASKANEAAKRAAPRVSQAIQATRTRAAAEAEWKRSAAARGDADADGEYSPTRGQRHEAETAAAIAAAASSRYDSDGGGGGGPDAMPEMPPDLIKFLNDAGPLQRTVDKDRTSPKVYDALVNDEKARDEQAKQANARVRRKMPIMSSYKNNGQDGLNDGTMTERTTNFSTKNRSSAPMGMGLTREDLFRLSDKVKGLKVDTPDWRKNIEAEYLGVAKKSNKSKSFDQLKDMTVFENSLRYIGVPVIMKDSDSDIIGVWPSKVDDLKFSSGLKLVPESSVQFVMHNEQSVAKES